MNTFIKIFFLLFSITAFSQVAEKQNYILLNASSDTVVTLNTLSSSFDINTNFKGNYKVEILHLRENKLVSFTIFQLTNFKYSYISQPLTNDVFWVQLISFQSDSILEYKIFHVINSYLDNITKLNIESLNHCNDSIHAPYAFTFNVFINDKKTNNYEVEFFKTFKTNKTSEYESTTIYNDSIAVRRDSNFFYLPEKFDSIAILIQIGKSGKFFYEIINPNFKYGGSLYFAVSTNDKKLHENYKKFVENKKHSELREIPYLSIAKGFSDAYYFGKKHSVLYINCNEKCNSTAINYDFKSEWYSLKDLK